MRTEQEMYSLIKKIAENDKRIRAAYLHGSRANPNALRDNFSDYDVVYVVTEIGSFLQNKDWINNFGEISFVFQSYVNQNQFFMREVNDLSRRFVWSMLFTDGSHIDLMLEIIEEAGNHAHIKNKPKILLLDKDGCLPEWFQSSNEQEYIKKPHKDEYTACCSGFWWFLNTTAKGIGRDQLAYAKAQFTSFNLMLINRMIEWYIGVQTDFTVPIDKDGKYYKKYLPTEIYDLYAKLYSDGNYKNFWNSVFSSCDLFNKIACEVGDYFNFCYNKQEEEIMREYLIKVKNNCPE